MHPHSEDDPEPYTIHAGDLPFLWMRQEAVAKGLVFEPESFLENLPICHQVSFSDTGKHESR